MLVESIFFVLLAFLILLLLVVGFETVRFQTVRSFADLCGIDFVVLFLRSLDTTVR